MADLTNLLRTQPDSQDLRAYREWLRHTVDIYPTSGRYGGDGEPIYSAASGIVDDPDAAVVASVPIDAAHTKVRCYVDARRRAMKSSTQELLIVDATVQFDRYVDIDEGYILRNAFDIAGQSVCGDMRVEDVIDDVHPWRGWLLYTALCKLH